MYFLNWLGLHSEKPSHVLCGLRIDFYPFWVLPSLFGSGLKESTEPAADIQDVARSVAGKILRCFRPQFSFPAPAVFPFEEFSEAAGMAGNSFVKNFLSIDDCPKPRRYVHQSAPATAHMPKSILFEEELWVISSAQVTNDVNPLPEGGIGRILDPRGHFFLREISIRSLYHQSNR